MTAQKRTHDELIEELNNQLAALKASCAGYDAGDFWEAPRLATIVYTLVNDGQSKIVSILTQLGLRNNIGFASYATPQNPHNLLGWLPLCMMHLANNDCLYVPVLDQGPPDQMRTMRFKDWWGEPVFQNAAGNKLSRMNLVFSLRSKDGGSHYDAELPVSTYLELKTDGLGFEFQDGSGNPTRKLQNAHLATMRHIAFELEQSILPHL